MKSIKRMGFAVVAGLLVLASLSVSPGPASAQIKLRIGFVVIPIHLGPLI